MTAEGDSGLRVAPLEIPPGDQRDAHRRQKTWRDVQIPRIVGIHRPAGDPHALVSSCAFEQARRATGWLSQFRGSGEGAPAWLPTLQAPSCHSGRGELAWTLTIVRLLGSKPRSVRTSFAKLIRHNPATNSTTKPNAVCAATSGRNEPTLPCAFRCPISTPRLATRPTREAQAPRRTGTSPDCPRQRETRADASPDADRDGRRNGKSKASRRCAAPRSWRSVRPARTRPARAGRSRSASVGSTVPDRRRSTCAAPSRVHARRRGPPASWRRWRMQ